MTGLWNALRGNSGAVADTIGADPQTAAEISAATAKASRGQASQQ